MNRRTAYPSRRSVSVRLRKRLTGAAVIAAASCVALATLLLGPDQVLAARSDVADTTVPVLRAPSAALSPVRAPVSAPATMARHVYPYSIIPGGVSGREELASVIKTDKVVAAHYASFDVDKAIKLTVGKPRAVHVSYRKGDKVYWTAKKLMLVEGETLLSDGRSEMRARCANRISDVPQFPVELNEPTAEELDSVIGVAMDTAELGLDEAAADGFGLALASADLPSNSDTGGASFGNIRGNRTTLTKMASASGSSSIDPSELGNATSGSTVGPPIVVAPSQSQTEDKGDTPDPAETPGSKPSTPVPEVQPPAPDGSTTPGPDDTPVTLPAPPGNVPPPGEEPPTDGPDTPLPPLLPPEPLPWPPGSLPEQPEEPVHELPEPGTLWLSAAAFAGMLLLRRKGMRPKRA